MHLVQILAFLKGHIHIITVLFSLVLVNSNHPALQSTFPSLADSFSKQNQFTPCHLKGGEMGTGVGSAWPRLPSKHSKGLLRAWQGRNKDICESHKSALAAPSGADRGWTGVCSDLLQAKLSGWMFLPSRDSWCVRAGYFTVG